jgi:hypothetical protein
MSFVPEPPRLRAANAIGLATGERSNLFGFVTQGWVALAR